MARAYDFLSGIYDKTIAKGEFRYHSEALKKITWRPEMRILEVAPGPGRVLARIAEQVGEETTLYGLDLSHKMLTRARKRLDELGFRNYELKEGDCRQLPWPDEHFDLLYNGYMMDLIPSGDMDGILKEFRRVLKPGGQLILLNMSNQDDKISLWERLYGTLPEFVVLYLMGNCRPVRMEENVVAAGFQKVEREFLAGRLPSEIVTAIKETR
jgi:ubiquinone/menaquinone biosynthesis C-methylase UbiE